MTYNCENAETHHFHPQAGKLELGETLMHDQGTPLIVIYITIVQNVR